MRSCKPWLAAVVTVCLGACSTVQVTPHLPSLIWQTPPNPAPTAPTDREPEVIIEQGV